MNAQLPHVESAGELRESGRAAPSRQDQAVPFDVLLVQGSPETADALAALGPAVRLNVSQSASSKQVLEDLKARPCALVVMDVGGTTLAMAEAIASMIQESGIYGLCVAEDADVQQQLAASEPGAYDCLLRPVPKALIASKVRLFTQLRRQRDELNEKDRILKNELELAARVQSRFFPVSRSTNKYLRFSIYHAACSKIGGDLQDAFDLARNRLGVYIADVSGHGTSTAMLSGSVKMSFEALKNHIDPAKLPVGELMDPGVLITRINAIFHESLPLECTISLMYAVIDPNARTLRISNAGHPFPVLYRGETAEASSLRFPSGPTLGPQRHAYYPVRTFDIRPGDKLLFFTDGLVKAKNEQGDPFGEDRLVRLMKDSGATSTEQLLETIARQLDEYRGGRPLEDDCSLLAVHLV